MTKIFIICCLAERAVLLTGRQNAAEALLVRRALTRLEVREGSDFPRWMERMRSRLEESGDGSHAVCVGWWPEGSSRYFPAE